MKVKRLTKKQKLFWLDLQGRVGDHVVQYGRPEEIAIVIGEELSRVNNNNDLNKRVDQYLNAIMDRNFPPVDVTSIMRSWLTFYCLSIDPNKLTTSQYRFNQRYRQYIRTNSKRFYNVEEYCSDNTLAQYISRRILK
jgi:hypothetical protein